MGVVAEAARDRAAGDEERGSGAGAVLDDLDGVVHQVVEQRQLVPVAKERLAVVPDGVEAEHLAVELEEAAADLLGVLRLGVEALVLEDRRHLARLLVLQLPVLVRIQRDLEPVRLLDALCLVPFPRIVITVNDVHALSAHVDLCSHAQVPPRDEAPFAVVDPLTP